MKIFQMGHKPLDYGYWESELYDVLQTGNLPENFSDFRDNTGENISEKNRWYLETTGIYWIWKNWHEPIKGQCQYRRRLYLPENFNFKRALGDYDIIAAFPIRIHIKEQYKKCHYLPDLEKIISYLKEDYSDVDEFFGARRQNLYYSNSFIMKEEDYDTYCAWLFKYLDRFFEELGISDNNQAYGYVKSHFKNKFDYQVEIGGFLSERLLSYYIWHNKMKVLHIPYTKFEGV